MPYKINYSNCFLSIDGAVPDASLANSEATMYLDTTSKDIILRFRDDVGSLHTTVLGEADSFTSQEVLFGDTDGSFAQASNFKYDQANNSLMFGDSLQTTTADGAGMLGGNGNTLAASSNFSVTLGGSSNDITSGTDAAMIGGINNSIAAGSAVTLGGNANSILAGATYSVIAGGSSNASSGNSSGIFCGSGNSVTNTKAAVIGGNTCTASGNQSVTIGGATNSSTALNSVTIGGNNNTNGGDRSIILGGRNNTIDATADNSIAVGKYANPSHNYSVLFNLNSGSASNVTTTTDQSFAVLSVNGTVFGDQTPHASAEVTITSTAKGFLGPRGTTAQMNAITSPAEGLEFYDLTTHQKMLYNGTAWVILG